jgi:hypothetical protein
VSERRRAPARRPAAIRAVAEFDDLRTVSSLLATKGIEHALGGSGLMHFLGVDVDVNDWDITTDLPEGRVREIVERFPHTRLEQVEPFRSRFAFSLSVGSSSIDLIGGFAVNDGRSVVECRTIVTGYRDSVPLGSPLEWEKIYRALGRDGRADQLVRMRP